MDYQPAQAFGQPGGHGNTGMKKNIRILLYTTMHRPAPSDPKTKAASMKNTRTIYYSMT